MDVIEIMTMALGVALVLAAPFLGIGVMARLIRGPSAPGHTVGHRIRELEGRVASLTQELAEVRELSTTHALSSDTNLDGIQNRINFLERRLRQMDAEREQAAGQS